MTGEFLTYFCDCYYLMVDYDQSLEEIVFEFIEKETEERVTNTFNEIAAVIEDKNEDILEYIIEKSVVLSTDREELNELIQDISDVFKEVKKV